MPSSGRRYECQEYGNERTRPGSGQAFNDVEWLVLYSEKCRGEGSSHTVSDDPGGKIRTDLEDHRPVAGFGPVGKYTVATDRDADNEPRGASSEQEEAGGGQDGDVPLLHT